ncbi:ABC transporter ATP-binding protein [Sporanaerobacter acetigenes]|uniref:ABC transporter ATP-binding protein n=1 Tax=Sporanaerobacter acetigenes TaxID=165813 RepID=UPI0033210CF8
MGIKVQDLYVNYGEKEVIKGVNLQIEDGHVVTVIGPNGSGKSTILKSISRCLKPVKGKVYLDDENIYTINTKKVAQKLAILPQVKNVSSDVVVEELVSYGRYPHLGFGKKLKKEDLEIVDWAIEKTGLKDLRKRFVATLSGGERQRAWIAMSLAQKPKILLLDEPTTFLDISYQLEVLELIKELNETLNLTVVMVLHDLNQAARYSDEIFVIKDGKLSKSGCPEDIINASLLKDVFRIEADIYEDSINNCPYFIPKKINKVVN